VIDVRQAITAVVALVLLAAAPHAASAQGTANPHEAAIGACATCHLPEGWRPVRISKQFHHAEKVFPLEGAHASAACTSCHTPLDFSKASPQCASCHRDVHRGELGVNCARCHTTRTFVDQARLVRMHEETRFPLRGMHATAACESCHPGTASGQPQYSGRPTTCVGCHRQDFDHATSPPHAGFPTACTTCHTETGWKGAPFDHNTTAFPLTGSHQATPCASCHADGVFKGKATDCLSCHKPDFDHTNDPPHAAAAFATTCATCHATSNWQGAVFDHDVTQFPLTGGHVTATCASCHSDGVFHGKPTTCVSCHKPDYDKTSTPPHFAAAFATTCATCHTTTTWLSAPFDHNTTQFPLTGGHLTVTCAQCHSDGVYAGKPTTCVSCHKPDYDQTKDPPHAAASFATTCATCHTTATWLSATFDHNTTQFPLTGAHLSASCASCHADGVYRGKPTTCVSCHQPDYDKTTNPSHSAVGFPTDCATCHTGTTTWTGAVFNHNTTAFPLTGAHTTVACTSCHGDGVFKGKPTTCVSCHKADYDKTSSPAHAAAGYSTDCTLCHTTAAWQTANFDHNTTQFPLTGAHVTVACASCHGDGVFKGKPTTCVSCHQPDFDKTSDPPHGTAGFATTCATCHTTTTWLGAVFDHNTTLFPLTGAHAPLSCASCHADGVFKGKPTTCVSCHQANYATTNDPPHGAAGFATTCADCHTMTTWAGATFNHSATLFPLTGAHLAASCSACHSDGVYKGKPTTCVSCHKPDYDGTNNPPHAAAGYGTDCTTCHTGTTTWQGAVFDHNTTQFPLTGAHLAVACSACHGDGVFKGKPTTCVSCHQPDYNATATPPHVAAGFNTTCNTCHSSTTWLSSSWTHDATGWSLTGVHTSTPCASCHGDGVYHGKSTLCATCHTPEYNSTTNPIHSAAHFPTTCESCHTTSTWLGATFNHDASYFPIYSGSHKNRWTTCADCHTAPTDFAVFTCTTTCHAQATTDSHHRGNSQYRYQSSACYSCHPRGSGG